MEGLVVDFDGKRNLVMYKGLKEYPIGGMIAEYARLHPAVLKDIILEYPDLDKEATEEYLSAFFPWFADKLEEKFGTITSVMVTVEMLDLVVDIMRMTAEEKDEWFGRGQKQEDTIFDYIFKDTGYDCPGMDSVKQLLLTCYLWFSGSYVAFKHSFMILASDGAYDEKQVDAFLSFFGENINMQHIDFQIAIYEGQFHSLYTLKSSMSLLAFETAHCMDNNVKFVKCANCNEYFVPEGRSDAIYCSYPSPQNPSKTCKEIGAQVTRANKEKNDVATKEYRKVYMKYKMITIRHPEDREGKKTFDRLVEEVKSWRKNMANGTVTTEEFLEWLSGF